MYNALNPHGYICINAHRTICNPYQYTHARYMYIYLRLEIVIETFI